MQLEGGVEVHEKWFIYLVDNMDSKKLVIMYINLQQRFT